MLVDPRVLPLRFCRFGSELSHVSLTSRLSSFRNSFNVGILCIDEIARPLHGERWDLPSNLEGRARRWIRQKGSPCPRQLICLAWIHGSTCRSGSRSLSIWPLRVTTSESGSSPTFANSPTFESTLNLALTCTLHKPDTMSTFAPHRSSNSNPQDSVPAEGLHVRLQGRGRSVQDATSSDADVRKSR